MIDIKKISIVLPEGVTKQGEISLKGNEAELTVVGTTLGPKLIAASYDGGASKTGTLTVTEVTQFTGLTTNPAGKVYCNEPLKLVATFSKVPVLSEVKVYNPVGFTQTEAPKVVGHNVEVSYNAPAAPVIDAEFTVDFRTGTTAKTVKVNVEEKPALLESVDASKKTARVTEVTTVTFKFDKAPTLDLMEIKPSAGLTVKDVAKVEGNNIVVSYTCNTAGSQSVVGTYNGVSKTCSIEVVKDAVIATAVAEPASVEVGQTTTLNVTYDKEFVTGQAPLEIVAGTGFAVKTPYAENLAKNGGTAVLVISQEGAVKVTLRFGGAEKVVTITGTPKPVVRSVDVEPKVIEQGAEATVKVNIQ